MYRSEMYVHTDEDIRCPDLSLSALFPETGTLSESEVSLAATKPQ